MAFENVNVISLKSALNSYKQKLRYRSIEYLIDNLNGDRWVTDSKKNLKKSLENLIEIKYQPIIKKIDEYLDITDQISKYQKLQNKNKILNNNIKALTPSLKTGSYVTTTYKDSNGDTQTKTEWVVTINEKVKAKIDNLNKQIKENKTEMNLLETKIKNSI